MLGHHATIRPTYPRRFPVSARRNTTAGGRALGLDVTAEAVETERQAAALPELGCDPGQGTFFAEPYPAAAMEARLSEARRVAGRPVYP